MFNMMVLKRLYQFVIVALLLVPLLLFRAKSASQLQPQPNLLHNIMHDIQDNLFRIDQILELEPLHLQKYGVVRVLNDDSVIVNAFLADLTMSSNYLPTFETLKMQQSKMNDYVQVSFALAIKHSHKTGWEPVGPCRSNARSSSQAIFNQGWSLDIMSGVASAVSLSAGVAFQWESDVSAGISGVISCVVGARETLQFQMRTEIWRMVGVKTRTVTIKPGGYFGTSSLHFGDWVTQDIPTIVNYRRTETACVTEPKMLQCANWDENEWILWGEE